MYARSRWLQRRKVRSFARSKAGRARVKQDASAIAALPLARIVPSHGVRPISPFTPTRHLDAR